MNIAFQNTKRETIVTSLFALACLFLYILFPTTTVFQQIVSLVAFLLIIPMIYIKIVLKKPLKFFGLGKGDAKAGIISGLIALFFLFALFYLAMKYTQLISGYKLPVSVAGNFWIFLGYEVLIIGSFSFLYEFFFRGFFLFTLERSWGGWSVAIQYLFFLGMLLTAGVTNWESWRYVLAGLAGGVVAYRSSSCVYSFVTTFIYMVATDAIIIGLSR